MSVVPLVPLHEMRLQLPSPVEPLVDPHFSTYGVQVLLKRDDLIHPHLPGNKWRKLKLNLVAAREAGHSTLLTFGGAYSNHLLAVAAAGYYFGFETVGVVRGEEHLPLNEVLECSVRFGMKLTYMDRAAYREKTAPDVIEQLRTRFGRFYLLPEGGSNPLGVRGCSELTGEIAVPFDVICCAVGTGGTLAGISGGLLAGRRALGFAVLKGGQFLDGDVAALQQAAFGEVLANWSIETRFHGGGYARRTPTLTAFTREFEASHGVRLNWVYEAKMMFGLYELVGQGAFSQGTTIVAVIA